MGSLTDACALPGYDFEQPALRWVERVHIVKTKSTRNAVLVGLHPPFRGARPLKWRSASAILKSLVREHRAHTAFMCRLVIRPLHEVQFPGTGVAVVTRP